MWVIVAAFLAGVVGGYLSHFALYRLLRRHEAIQPLRLFALFAGGVVLAMIVGFFVLYPWTPDERGTFGDMFGWAGALFSGLAFAGVVSALWMQQQDLQLTREELRLTRKELKAQNESLREQTFQRAIFQMLKLLDDLREQMRSGQFGGAQAFTKTMGFFRNQLAKLEENQPQGPKIDRVRQAISALINNYTTPYLRTVEVILNQVREGSEQVLLEDVFLAQLSRAESALIFYYGLSEEGESLGDLLVEFDIVERLAYQSDLLPGYGVELYQN